MEFCLDRLQLIWNNFFLFDRNFWLYTMKLHGLLKNLKPFGTKSRKKVIWVWSPGDCNRWKGNISFCLQFNESNQIISYKYIRSTFHGFFYQLIFIDLLNRYNKYLTLLNCSSVILTFDILKILCLYLFYITNRNPAPHRIRKKKFPWHGVRIHTQNCYYFLMNLHMFKKMVF